jgi:hypothetical protein
MIDEDLVLEACRQAGAKDAKALASLLFLLIDEETQSLHHMNTRGIMPRLKALIDGHLKEA